MKRAVILQAFMLLHSSSLLLIWVTGHNSGTRLDKISWEQKPCKGYFPADKEAFLLSHVIYSVICGNKKTPNQTLSALGTYTASSQTKVLVSDPIPLLTLLCLALNHDSSIMHSPFSQFPVFPVFCILYFWSWIHHICCLHCQDLSFFNLQGSLYLTQIPANFLTVADRNICCLVQNHPGTCRLTSSFLFHGWCQMQQTINRVCSPGQQRTSTHSAPQPCKAYQELCSHRHH